MTRRTRKTRIALSLLSAAALAGCSDARGNTPRGPASQYIVSLDVSGSRTPTQRAEARQAIAGLVNRMTYGDRLVVVQTYKANSDAATQWADSIPAPRFAGKITGKERQSAERFRRKALLVTSTILDPAFSGRINTTDILFTMARAADYARSANGRRTTLLVLSDMLQSTPEVNMEAPGGIPDASWIAGRKASGRLPDLRGVCVVVSGADVVSARGAAVRQFWEQYFQAAGAELRADNYRNLISNPSEIGCG